jgi:hypothetical protein
MRQRAAIITVVAIATTACHTTSGLERLTEAQQLSADLLVNFTRADAAANKAVMADTDEASAAFARDADRAKQAIQREFGALKPILDSLGYSEESRLLEEFRKRFEEYLALDRTILELAVENTNLKAQRLSFGAAAEAADAFRDALQGVVPPDAAKDTWRVRALVATAVSNVREIQVLQAPHIAEPNDAEMTRMEARMQTARTAARTALEALGPLVQPPSRKALAEATGALDRFMTTNAEITALSRRNTNVRSLALSLNQKGKLTAACEETLGALRDALAKRGFSGTR